MEKDPKRIFIGNLTQDIDYKDIMEQFLPFGDIKSIDIPADPISKESKGFAFVEYDEEEDAKHAVFNKHNSVLKGQVLSVDIARPYRNKDMLNRPIWADEDYYQSLINN